MIFIFHVVSCFLEFVSVLFVVFNDVKLTDKGIPQNEVRK